MSLTLPGHIVANAEPVVAPDGKRVVFSRDSYREGGAWSRDLYSVALTGGAVRQLTRTSGRESSPTIGRSGALYFERDGWIYETALGKTRRVARGGHPAKDPSVRGLLAFAYAGHLHANAKLGLGGRFARVQAIEGGCSIRSAAARFNVSPATAHRWWHRWREATEETRATLACLVDRSSRPRQSPRERAASFQEAICACRRETGWGPRRTHAALTRPKCSNSADWESNDNA